MMKDANSQDLFEEDDDDQASLPCGQGTYRKESQSQQKEQRESSQTEELEADQIKTIRH